MLPCKLWTRRSQFSPNKILFILCRDVALQRLFFILGKFLDKLADTADNCLAKSQHYQNIIARE